MLQSLGLANVPSGLGHVNGYSAVVEPPEGLVVGTRIHKQLKMFLIVKLTEIIYLYKKHLMD